MRNRLRRFSQEERKDKDWMRECMYMEVEEGQEGGQMKPGWKVVKKDLKELGKGRYSGPSKSFMLGIGRLWGTHADPGLPGAPLEFFPK